MITDLLIKLPLTLASSTMIKWSQPWSSIHYSWTLITRTLSNSNSPLTQSKKFQFPLGFRHIFAIILNPITRTPIAETPLIRNDVYFPSGTLLCNFTLDNSKSICEYIFQQMIKWDLVINILKNSYFIVLAIFMLFVLFCFVIFMLLHC